MKPFRFYTATGPDDLGRSVTVIRSRSTAFPFSVCRVDKRKTQAVWIGLVLWFVLAGHGFVCAQPPITVSSDLSKSLDSWTLPSSEGIRAELETWSRSLQKNGMPSETETILAEGILADWKTTAKFSGKELFDKTIDSMRRLSPAIESYLEACNSLAWKELPFGEPLVLPQIPLQIYLGDSNSSKYLVGTLRYYLALRLVQARLYDEAAPILDELTSQNSVDPLGVLIHRAIVCNQLSKTTEGLEAITAYRQAEKNETNIPRRFTELAKLLEFDLNQQRESQENPQKISRQMNDVRRRLGKGKTDDDTQQAEKDVMKSLDRLIEKIERQCEQQCQQGDGEGQQANKPADDSRLLKQKGPGNVDRRDFDPAGNWGDLPPKEREETLLKIEKEFPAHYRDIIEQYFREMATRNN